MRITLVTLLTIAALRADTVTLTYSTPYPFPEQTCGNLNACQPFNLFVLVPPTDATGALTSVAWAITDSQSYYGGFNDVGQPPGETFSWTTTEGDQIAPLYGTATQGVTVTNTQQNTGVTTGSRQISAGGFWRGDLIQASGVLDAGATAALGGAAFAVTPFLFADQPPAYEAVIWTSLIIVQDYGTLTVTAGYGGTAVPEPRLEFLLVLLVLLAGAAWRRGKRA